VCTKPDASGLSNEQSMGVPVCSQDQVMASAIRCAIMLNPFVHVNKSLARVLESVEDDHAPLAELAKLP